MDYAEYQKVREMTYLEYCDYLQEKYGIGIADYMTKSFNKTNKCSRTKEGLVVHHKAEDKMIMLSTKEFAQLCPFEWQQKENLVYCDYLEHLWLHILICKYPSPEKMPMVNVGIGGVVNFLVPELNDMYSGWETKQAWRKTCHDRVRNDLQVYLEMLKEFITFEQTQGDFDVDILCKSLGASNGTWSETENFGIYSEIWEMAK